jgi:predicted enzyme related to lactoylglutathione lyase
MSREDMMAGYGGFVWYELLTSDKKAAESFYERVLGWTVEDARQPGIDYDFITVDGARIGGVMTSPEETCSAGARPAWLGYIGVENADATAEAVAERGGRVLRAPQDIPGYGRFAVLADPQGAAFCVIAPTKDYAGKPSPAHRPGVPGFGGWHELYANDREKAFDFYSSLFGWTKDQAIDLGENGVYQLFAIGDVVSGGVMTRCGETPKPAWNYYFNVESVEAAISRIRDGGGEILMGPHQVPGGGWIVVARDPQGVPFSLVGAK